MVDLLILHYADLEALAAANEARRRERENTVAAIRAANERERAEAAAMQAQWREEAQRRQLLFLRKFFPDKYREEIARLKAEQTK